MSDVAHTKRAACLTPRFASMLRLGTWARQATKAVTRDFDMAPCCVVRVQLGAEHVHIAHFSREKCTASSWPTQEYVSIHMVVTSNAALKSGSQSQ